MVNPHDKKYISLVKYAEGVARSVGIKYGMAHIEVKAQFDEKRGRWVDPAMIEVGARLAGGRKAVMAEATVSYDTNIMTLNHPTSVIRYLTCSPSSFQYHRFLSGGHLTLW